MLLNQEFDDIAASDLTARVRRPAIDLARTLLQQTRYPQAAQLAQPRRQKLVKPLRARFNLDMKLNRFFHHTRHNFTR
jgi:hypothetical protein